MGAESYLNNGVFSVTLYGMELSFARVSGIGGTQEFDTYAEGGAGVVILPKPKTSAGTLTFERGVTSEKWAGSACFTVGVAVSGVEISIIKHGSVIQSYEVDDAIVTAWELGELNALASGVLIKKFTLSHNGIKVL